MSEQIRYVVTINESKYWTFAVANGKGRGGWLARDKDLGICLRQAVAKIEADNRPPSCDRILQKNGGVYLCHKDQGHEGGHIFELPDCDTVKT